MSAVRTVWLHELRDALRDRRMVMVALFSAFLPSVLQIGLDAVIRDEVQSRREASLAVASSDRARAPNLFEWLEAHDVTFVEVPAEADQALRDRRIEVMLEVDPSYGEDWRSGHSAKVSIASDSTQLRAQESVRRLEQLLGVYGGEVGSLRLVLRGIAPEVQNAVVVGERDVAPATSTNLTGIILLPFLLLMGAMVGAGTLAVDLTAGERERQSIESLLATAARREHIMLGKIFAASSYGSAILVAQALVLFGLSTVFKSDAYHLELKSIVPLLLTLFPLVVLVATLLTGMSAFSKTVREAQSAMSVVVLLPLGPLLYLLAVQPKPTLAMYATPVLGQFQLCVDILRGDHIPLEHPLVNFGAMALVCIPAIWFCSRLYRREGLAISA
jgi:sodium transport system permease protein